MRATRLGVESKAVICFPKLEKDSGEFINTSIHIKHNACPAKEKVEEYDKTVLKYRSNGCCELC